MNENSGNTMYAKILAGVMIALLSSTTIGGFMAWRELAVMNTTLNHFEFRLEKHTRRIAVLEEEDQDLLERYIKLLEKCPDEEYQDD